MVYPPEGMPLAKEAQGRSQHRRNGIMVEKRTCQAFKLRRSEIILGHGAGSMERGAWRINCPLGHLC